MNTYLKFILKNILFQVLWIPGILPYLLLQCLNIRHQRSKCVWNRFSTMIKVCSCSASKFRQGSLSCFRFHSLGPQEGTCCLLQIKHAKILFESSLKHTFKWSSCTVNLSWQSASQLLPPTIQTNKTVLQWWEAWR